MDEVVELVGGPADGRVWEVADLPPILFVPAPGSDLLDISPTETYPTSIPRVAEYERDVISDESHRWRYRYRRTR